jgi:hypothetical protein
MSFPVWLLALFITVKDRVARADRKLVTFFSAMIANWDAIISRFLFSRHLDDGSKRRKQMKSRRSIEARVHLFEKFPVCQRIFVTVKQITIDLEPRLSAVRQHVLIHQTTVTGKGAKSE